MHTVYKFILWSLTNNLIGYRGTLIIERENNVDIHTMLNLLKVKYDNWIHILIDVTMVVQVLMLILVMW